MASDTLRVSGRKMQNGLIERTRNAEVLADLAKGQDEIEDAGASSGSGGVGVFPHARPTGQKHSGQAGFLAEVIASLSAQINEVLVPFGAQVGLLDTIPVVDRGIAEGPTAEIGVDMSRLGSPKRLGSCAGMCPGNHESQGKRRSEIARKGSKWLGTYLRRRPRLQGEPKTPTSDQWTCAGIVSAWVIPLLNTPPTPR